MGGVFNDFEESVVGTVTQVAEPKPNIPEEFQKALPEPPTPETSAEEIKGAAQKERRRARSKSSNILTGGKGLTAESEQRGSVSRRILLGT